jgi:hypothetical protein
VAHCAAITTLGLPLLLLNVRVANVCASVCTGQLGCRAALGLLLLLLLLASTGIASSEGYRWRAPAAAGAV